MATRLKGIKAVRRAVRQMPLHLREESALETREIVDEMHTIGRSRIPVLSGKGRRNYRKSFNPKTLKGRVGYLSSTAFSQVFYMRFIHDGTVEIVGNYFHERAFDAVQGGYFPAQRRALERAIRK